MDEKKTLIAIRKVLARWNLSCAEESCLKKQLADELLLVVKNCNAPAVVGQSEQLVCPECNSEDPDYTRGEYHCRCCGHDWAN